MKADCGLVDGGKVHPGCDQHPYQLAKTLRQIHHADKCPELTDGAWAALLLETLDPVIAYMEATDEEDWQIDTVRSADGTTNCFFGHLFSMGGTDARGNALWDRFEGAWASTFRLYPINDGTSPSYPQATPKQRILAFLQDLNTGSVLTTPQQMEDDYNHRLAEENRSAGVHTI